MKIQKFYINMFLYFFMQIISVTTFFVIIYKNNALNFRSAIFIFLLEATLIISAILYIRAQKKHIRQSTKLDALKLQKEIFEKQKLERDQSEKDLDEIYSYIKKHIDTLKKLDKEKDYETLSQYISDQFDNVSTKSTHMDFCKRSAVNASLCHLYNLAEQKNVHADFVMPNSEDINIPDLQLCIILLNLIENAIDAAHDFPNGIVYMRSATKHNRTIIKIQNSAKSFDPKLRSTKKDQNNHGLGIGIVKSIIKEYNGDISFSFNDNICTCIITI